jgi:terminase small subunit / prophage DNA-packing protein
MNREPIEPKTGPGFGTAAELADWIGVTTKTVYQLADRGIVIRAGRGCYDLRASIRGYAAHMRDLVAGRGAGEAMAAGAATARKRLAEAMAAGGAGKRAQPWRARRG